MSQEQTLVSKKLYPVDQRIKIADIKILEKHEESSVSDLAKKTKFIIRALNRAEIQAQEGIAKEHLLRIEIDDINKFYMQRGAHLSEEVFIPQYLGFEETVFEERDAADTRVYSRDGVNITKIPDGRWFVSGGEGLSCFFKINNLLQAIHIFQAIGLNVSVDTIIQDNSVSKAINETIQDIENNRYYYHNPESSSVWIQREPMNPKKGDGLVALITKEQYEELKNDYEINDES